MAFTKLHDSKRIAMTIFLFPALIADIHHLQYYD